MWSPLPPSIWPGTLDGMVEWARAPLCSIQSHIGVGASPQGAGAPLDRRGGIRGAFQTGCRLPKGWVERRGWAATWGWGAHDEGRAVSVDKAGLALTALLTFGMK